MTVSLFYASSLKLSRHRIISTGGFGRLIMTDVRCRFQCDSVKNQCDSVLIILNSSSSILDI